MRSAVADADYLESVIQTITTEKARQDELARSQEETRKAAVEHEKAMALLAAARVEELRAQATTLAKPDGPRYLPRVGSETSETLNPQHALGTRRSSPSTAKGRPP
ncbi:hypothetical protein ACFC25_16805 [Pseudarthrobacter sp. NPDC055928]|uniref:hypothetical protein n=1 Tax=Pseudarthrobacter sp. NPDC055928 TaxID=3345661 RepID=UPI0035E270FE